MPLDLQRGLIFILFVACVHIVLVLIQADGPMASLIILYYNWAGHGWPSALVNNVTGKIFVELCQQLLLYNYHRGVNHMIFLTGGYIQNSRGWFAGGNCYGWRGKKIHLPAIEFSFWGILDKFRLIEKDSWILSTNLLLKGNFVLQGVIACRSQHRIKRGSFSSLPFASTLQIKYGHPSLLFIINFDRRNVFYQFYIIIPLTDLVSI